MRLTPSTNCAHAQAMADLRDEDFRHFVCVESGAVRAAVAGGNGLEVGEGEVSFVFLCSCSRRDVEWQPEHLCQGAVMMLLLLLLLPPPPTISPHLQFRYFSPAGDTASRFPFNSKPNRKPPRVQGGGGWSGTNRQCCSPLE